MQYYQELTLIDQDEISPYFIWSKVYTQVHIAFADHKNASGSFSHAVSFPSYAYDDKKKKGTLGKKLRIFASSESQLKDLNLSKWLSRLTDYVHITSIKEVPSNVKNYAVYRFKRPKGESRLRKDIHKHAEYFAKEHNISYEDALKRYEHRQVKPVYLPYVQMESLSQQQRFKMFIEKTVCSESNPASKFTAYGLSSESTVPEF